MLVTVKPFSPSFSDDPLMESIAQEFSLQPEVFRASARRWTEAYAAPQDPATNKKRKGDEDEENEKPPAEKKKC